VSRRPFLAGRPAAKSIGQKITIAPEVCLAMIRIALTSISRGSPSTVWIVSVACALEVGGRKRRVDTELVEHSFLS
jgi:hypothetical protein